MPSVSFSHRLFFDTAFYNVIKAQAEGVDKQTILFKLIHINTHSKEHRRQHNCISNKTFNDILDKQAISRVTLRAAFYPLNEPHDIESIQNEIERLNEAESETQKTNN